MKLLIAKCKATFYIKVEDIVCSNRNISRSVNHSTAYSLIGYMCAYLRYYYPVQFITAFLNYAANDDDIKNGTQLAELKNIKIISPKFKHSTSNYSCDNNIIYKGTNSIKGLSKTIGDKLYSLKDKTYPTFFDLLIDCKENSIGIADLTILIKLDYFSEFGTIGKLLKFVDIYNELYGKKMIKKDKEYKVKQLYLKKFCAKETEKQYSGFDSEKCLRDLFDKIADQDISIKEKAGYQLQYFGYVDLKDSSFEPEFWLVLDFKEYGKNKMVELYRINNGEKKSVKMRANVFAENPIKKGDLLDILAFNKEGKWIKNSQTGKWERSGTTFEDFLNNYKIME